MVRNHTSLEASLCTVLCTTDQMKYSYIEFDIVCTVHRTAMCIYVEQLDAQILIMCLYLSLSALHVSHSLVHHQERRFGAVYRNWYKPVRLAVV